MEEKDYNTQYFPTWCPGCGNYSIWAALKGAVSKLQFKPEEFLIVYGIGCSGNMNDFVKSYGFHALHGRSVANAIGFKLANSKMPVICIVGDGDFYGEGGNHFIHAARGNHNITVIVHNNKVYGLTTGQASPTSDKGFKSKSTPTGIIEESANPLTLAISADATFVSRGFAGDIVHLKGLIIEAIKHQGFSLVDVLQPCVTFNKQNTYSWYRQKVYKIDSSFPTTDKVKAYKKALEWQDKIPIGVIYKVSKPTYGKLLPPSDTKFPKDQLIESSKFAELLKEFY